MSLLKVCQQELTSETFIKWKSIGYKVVGTTNEGNPRKASTLQYRKIPACEFFQYLWPKLEYFYYIVRQLPNALELLWVGAWERGGGWCIVEMGGMQ
jgi:hypothetical protein